jgi:transketolase
MREQFAVTLIELARKDKRIVVLAGDVLYNSLNAFGEEFPDRFFNLGLCEQTIISMAGGLASQGLRPVVYSITPFILERPLEFIKIDIDEANLPVILAGFEGYPTYGPTHRALDIKKTVDIFKNITAYYPANNEETHHALTEAYLTGGPSFISLKKLGPHYIPKGDSWKNG